MTASESDSPRLCPRCEAPMPQDAPGGLCPRCLLEAPLETETLDPSVTGSGKASQEPTLEEVQQQFPQLEILERLGRGGMGVVYKARQRSLDRLVALKLLAPERVSDPSFATRFEREARALARLSHSHIVTIHDFGTTTPSGGEEPRYFLLMEYVDGVNLRQAMEAGRFTPEQALAIVPPVCEALQYAHEQGVVHRDIKPENLLLDRQGEIKIADFGIAKMIGANPEREGDGGSPGVTTLAGTPRYMAPEQETDPGRVDHRADIYSLGAVLYELLTGEVPKGPLQPPSTRVEIDVRLDEVVLRALESAPELRYQTAGEFRTQVETMSTPTPGKTGAESGMKDEEWLGALGMGLAGSAGLLGFLSWFGPYGDSIWWAITVLELAAAGLWLGIVSWRTIYGKTAAVVGGINLTLALVAMLFFQQDPTEGAGFRPLTDPLMPALFVMTGLLMVLLMIPLIQGRVPMNSLYGIRVPGSFESNEAWMAINRRGAKWMMQGALWILAIGVIGFWVPASQFLTYSIWGTIGTLMAVTWPAMKCVGLTVETARNPAPRSRKAVWITNLLIALPVAFFLRSLVVESFRIAGPGVEPELTSGSHVLVWKLSGRFAPGDLVVFQKKDEPHQAGRVVKVTPKGVQVERLQTQAPELIPWRHLDGKIVTVLWRASGVPEESTAGGAVSTIQDDRLSDEEHRVSLVASPGYALVGEWIFADDENPDGDPIPGAGVVWTAMGETRGTSILHRLRQGELTLEADGVQCSLAVPDPGRWQKIPSTWIRYFVENDPSEWQEGRWRDLRLFECRDEENLLRGEIRLRLISVPLEAGIRPASPLIPDWRESKMIPADLEAAPRRPFTDLDRLEGKWQLMTVKAEGRDLARKEMDQGDLAQTFRELQIRLGRCRFLPGNRLWGNRAIEVGEGNRIRFGEGERADQGEYRIVPGGLQLALPVSGRTPFGGFEDPEQNTLIFCYRRQP